MKQRKTLYVTDLDGTLLNTDSKISPKSLAVLNRLAEQGVCVTYASARSLISANRVTGGLHTRIPVIVYNGAFLMDGEDGRILHSCTFTGEEREYVQKALKEHSIYPLVYSFIQGAEKVSWHTKHENEGIRWYLLNRKGDPRFRPADSREELYRGEVFYYTCIGEREELQPVYDFFQKDGRYRCTLQQELYRPEYWCEIMPVHATKAEAIGKLKQLLDCQRVVCFGDAVNDIPMFRQADECYAVENAVPKLKDIATGIIPGNDADGVALWLEQREGLGQL